MLLQLKSGRQTFQILYLPFVALASGLDHGRVKRNLPANEIQRLKDMSPSDRPNCKPGAVSTGEIKFLYMKRYPHFRLLVFLLNISNKDIRI